MFHCVLNLPYQLLSGGLHRQEQGHPFPGLQEALVQQVNINTSMLAYSCPKSLLCFHLTVMTCVAARTLF